MYRILIFVFLFLSVLNAVNNDFSRIYLNGGIYAVEKALNEDFVKKEFWIDQLKDQNSSLGYYTKDCAIVLINKKNKTFDLFYYENGKLINKFFQKNILTGLMGDKKIEGDLITPMGFYELGKKFFPGDPYYGPFAFSTTYPNLFDRVNGKTGSGIWIHGYPLNGDRIDEMRTRGCIALFNDKLEEFSTLIKDKTVYVIIEEDKKVRANKDEISSILSSLFNWKKAWSENDINLYLSFYDKDKFKKYDKTDYKKFAESKKAIFSKNDKKTISFSNINISPYPNVNNDKIFRISFYEDYYTKNYQFKGDKILYVRLDKDGKIKILSE